MPPARSARSDRAAARDRRRRRRRRRRPGTGRVEDREHLRSRPPTRGPRVVAHGQLPQRQEELRRDEQHRQRPVERDRRRPSGAGRSARRPAPSRPRRPSRARGRSGTRSGARPSSHRRSRSLISRSVLRLLAAPAEGPQRRQAAQHVDEERAAASAARRPARSLIGPRRGCRSPRAAAPGPGRSRAGRAPTAGR